MYSFIFKLVSSKLHVFIMAECGFIVAVFFFFFFRLCCYWPKVFQLGIADPVGVAAQPPTHHCKCNTPQDTSCLL